MLRFVPAFGRMSSAERLCGGTLDQVVKAELWDLATYQALQMVQCWRAMQIQYPDLPVGDEVNRRYAVLGGNGMFLILQSLALN